MVGDSWEREARLKRKSRVYTCCCFCLGGEETSLKHNSFGHPAFRFIWVRFFGEGALFMEAAMRASILGSASSMQNDTSVDNALQIKA